MTPRAKPHGTRGLTFYRQLLRVYPKAYRERFHQEMTEVFEAAECAATTMRGGKLRFWLREIRGVLVGAATEHLRALKGTYPVTSQDPRSQLRSATGPSLVELTRQDLTFALRSLRRHPAFSCAAVATLGLGIGATTAMFSLVNTILLTELPIPDPERVVQIQAAYDHSPLVPIHSGPAFRAYRDQNQVLEQVSGAFFWGTYYEGLDQSLQTVRLVGVTPGFLSLLGAQPALGRAFGPQDHSRPAEGLVAMLDHDYWTRRFGGDPDVVNQRITLMNSRGADRRVTVVGVLPEGFELPPMQLGSESAGAVSGTPLRPLASADILVAVDPDATDFDHGGWIFTALGRLKDGFTPEDATADLRAIHASRKVEAVSPTWGPFATSLPQLIRDRYGPSLLLVWAGTALLLLVTYANVASLLLAGAASRERELSLRASLGASRLRLFRQLLAESVTLGLAGGLLGIPVAVWITRALVSFTPGEVYRLEEASVDGSALIFLVATSILLALLFGSAPAMMGARTNPAENLGGVGRGSTRSIRGPLRALVVSEVALALVMLTCGMLLLRTYRNLTKVDLGFHREDAIAFEVETYPPGFSKYADDESRRSLARLVQERISALPEVEAIAGGTPPMATGEVGRNFTLEWGGMGGPSSEQKANSDQRQAEPGYFEVAGIPLLAGRTFDANDQDMHARARSIDIARTDSKQLQAERRSMELPIIVSATMARTYWGDAQSAIGKSLYWGAQGNLDELDNGSWGTGEWDPRFGIPYRHTIVGVVGDVKSGRLDREPEVQIYSPGNGLSFVVTARAEPLAVAKAIREEVRSLDPVELSVRSVRTLDELVREAAAEQRFRMLLVGASAATCLVLIALGLFSVMAYWVSRRTREIGVRVSLGARDRDIARLIGHDGLVIVATGGLLGLVASASLARLLSSLLFGVAPLDPTSFSAGLLLLTAVAGLACALPVMAAMRVHPVEVLKAE